MHFIERPYSCRLKGLDENGKPKEKEFDRMFARLVLHEMDHLDGKLFTRRIKEGNFAVPTDGFYTMSDWPDDFPSIEARSTFLYNVFVPPTGMEVDGLPDADLIKRRFEDRVYPGSEQIDSFGESVKKRHEDLKRVYAAAKEKEAEAAAEAANAAADDDDAEEQEAQKAGDGQ